MNFEGSLSETKHFFSIKSKLLATPIFEANTCHTIGKIAGKGEFQQAVLILTLKLHFYICIITTESLVSKHKKALLCNCRFFSVHAVDNAKFVRKNLSA